MQFFIFLYNQENLLREYDYNRLPTACQNLYKTMRDIDSLEISDELERFLVIVRTNLNFLIYIYRKQLLKVYPNLCIALRVSLTCAAVSVAGAERSFSGLKLIKIPLRSTMMDERLTSLAMISIERACVPDFFT